MDNNLEKRIATLERWKEAQTRQQITFPLDVVSQTILNKYYLSVISNIFNVSVSGQEFRSIVVQQDNKVNVIGVASQFMTYTANATTNILTLGSDLITGTQATLEDGQFITINTPTPGVPPAPLENGFGYFVVSSTGTTIQLSETLGGVAIDLTTTGTGTQYISSD
jgi:hypothetical protein